MAVGGRSEAHLPLGASHGCIIPGRDQHQLWGELSGHGKEDRVKHGEVVGRAAANCVQRDINSEARPQTLTNMIIIAFSEMWPISPPLIPVH